MAGVGRRVWPWVVPALIGLLAMPIAWNQNSEATYWVATLVFLGSVKGALDARLEYWRERLRIAEEEAKRWRNPADGS